MMFLRKRYISIHALREEGDDVDPDGLQPNIISIHALREEGDTPQPTNHCIIMGFLSTPSARRATPKNGNTPEHITHFYPRPPRGGRPGVGAAEAAKILISIHALREEGDRKLHHRGRNAHYFYPRPPRGGRRMARLTWITPAPFLSTPSARRATKLHDRAVSNHIISIHALREEGDIPPPCAMGEARYFYPRPPRGGRLRLYLPPRFWAVFLSTPSARRATAHRTRRWDSITHFYPRPPRGGRLHPFQMPSFLIKYFYPRPPRGGRPRGEHRKVDKLCISIHALREEGDSKNREIILCFCLIIHLPAQIAKRCL